VRFDLPNGDALKLRIFYALVGAILVLAAK
jgi:hypothetical protein